MATQREEGTASRVSRPRLGRSSKRYAPEVREGGYREPSPELHPFESVAGTDTIRRKGENLVVFAPEPMPDWRIGHHRRTAVLFRGTRFAVVGARAVVGGHEYELAPWTLRANELAAQEIVYDEAYVRARQDGANEVRTRKRQAWLLAPVWPLLGFLPRATKKRLHLFFAFEPIGGTRLSILAELVAVVFLATFLFLRAVAGVDWVTMRMGGGGATRDLILIVLFATDFVLRASLLYDDAYPAYGFWEWILHPEAKALIRRSYEAYRERRKRT
jgi:hypothetical protein